MKQIPLTQGKFAIVDDDDYEKLVQFKWHIMVATNNHKYAVRRVKINGKQKAILMHREIMKASDGFDIDHRNGNGLDNRRFNLRAGTHQQNQSNRKINKNSTSGYKGVVLFHDKNRTKPWRAQITYKGNRFYLGLYATKEEAANAYNQKAVELFGPFAQLNHIV